MVSSEYPGYYREGLKASSCDVNGMCGLSAGKVPCEVSRLGATLSLPEPVREEARRICSTAIRKKLTDRRPLPVVAASSLYAACREDRMPVTLKDLALISHSTRCEIGRSYRLILSGIEIPPATLNSTRYIERVGSKAHASEEATKLALEIEKKARDMGLAGRNPMTLAAAAVYTACLNVGERKTQASVADAAGVTEVSVRECAKAIRRLVRLTTSAP